MPEVAIGFWIIKIAATTLGETGGDALSMSLNLGYATSTIIFFVLFAVAVGAQIRARRFHAFLYWAVIVATTLTGTTMADFADRSLKIGYPGGSMILFGLLIVVLTTWRLRMGSISVECITSPKVEAFYWATILFSNTLGTALGDWVADSVAYGLPKAAQSDFYCRVHRSSGAYLFLHQILAGSACSGQRFVLTRPLGATLGDMLTGKPVANGGLNLSRYSSSAAIACFMVICILAFPQRSR